MDVDKIVAFSRDRVERCVTLARLDDVQNLVEGLPRIRGHVWIKQAGFSVKVCNIRAEQGEGGVEGGQNSKC